MLSGTTDETSLLMKGFLHDINNLFTCVIGSLGAARESMNDKESLAAWLDTARVATMKATDMTSLMMRVCNYKSEMEKDICDVKTIISKAVEIVRSRARAKITVLESTQSCMMHINGTAMVGVLLNLIMNSINASIGMDEEIRISYITESEAETCSDCRNVRITVEDKGIGMPQANVAALLGRNHGFLNSEHGIGFRMVRQIVEMHGGRINIESCCGQGTKVSILLPLMEQEN